MRTGDRVIVLRGEHEGRTGTITDAADNIAALRSAVLPGPTRNKIELQLEVPAGCRAVRIETPAAVRTVSIEEADLVVVEPRQVSLLAYLDHLESTTKAAPGGRWRNPSPDRVTHYGEVVSDEAPFDEGYAGQLVAESMSGKVTAFVIAMQPSATLALIAKLREAVEIVGEAVRLSTSQATDGQLNDLQDRAIAWNSIEVP